MSLFASVFWLVASLALILTGANILTDGASAIAKRIGISDLIIGLTVVAFGTSTPELVISIVAAADGNSSIAVGNIVGIANARNRYPLAANLMLFALAVSNLLYGNSYSGIWFATQ